MRRTRRLWIALLVLAVAQEGRGETLLSLFPSQGPLRRLAAVDGREPGESVLTLGRWHPFQLPGVHVNRVGLGSWLGPLRFAGSFESQHWGPLAASVTETMILLRRGGALRLGASFRHESLAGATGAEAVELLVSTSSLTLRYRCWDSLDAALMPRSASGLLGLFWAKEAWSLRVWRSFGPEFRHEEGAAIYYRKDTYMLSFSADSSVWQALEFGFRRERWSWSVQLRLHPLLGLSQGMIMAIN